MISGLPRIMRSISRGDALLALIAFVMIWGAAAIHLTQERQHFLHAAETNAQNLSRAFSEHILGAIRSVDQTLLLVRRDWSGDPTHFRLSDWATATNSIDDLAIQLSMIGADGKLMQTTVGPSAPIDLSDREHFIVQRDATTEGLFISKPVLGRASGKWTIQFTRRLLAPDGAFAGVVVGSVDVFRLSHFYETIDVGGQGAIALLGTDGVVRARAPIMEGMIGRQMTRSPASHVTETVDTGVYVGTSELDGIRRIFAFRRVSSLPLVVTVGLSDAEVLAPFYRDLKSYLVASLALSAVAFGALAISGHYRRRHRAANDALDATLENISQGVLMVGPDRRISVMNSKVVELLDLPPELMDANPTFDDLLEWQLRSGEFGPAGHKSGLRQFVEAGGIALGDSVYERERPNGQHIEVRTRVLPDGSAVRTFTDVTEHRRFEQALARARDAAERASEARTRFLAIVSHEIRTPMNGVIGLADLLGRTELSGEQMRWVTTLQASANHLLRLIDDILDFTRLNADEIEFEQIAFDPVVVAHEAFQCIENRAAEKGLAHEVIAPDTNCIVEGDPARLRQVLINLLGNAVKFTATGSVRLFLLPPEIVEGDATLHFLVQDTGIGIPHDALPRLFHEFSQIDGSIARCFGGSGLGLAISQRLVERMGGTITVKSEPGRGSVFEVMVRLPVSTMTIEPSPGGAVSDRTFRPLTILLAEDDATNRLVATAMLEKMGHSVCCAVNGLEAVEAVAAKRFDFVLMDMMMPVMDGLSATRAVRALPGESGHVPIFAFTANAFKEEIERCRRAGVDGFLAKPLIFDALQRVTERMPAASWNNAPPEPTPTAPDGPHFDAAVIRGLIDSLGATTVLEIRAAFLGELPQRLKRMAHAQVTGDWETLNREAHSLKSSAASLGLISSSEAAAAIERRLATTGTAACAGLLEALDMCASEGAAALRALAMAADEAWIPTAPVGATAGPD